MTTRPTASQNLWLDQRVSILQRSLHLSVRWRPRNYCLMVPAAVLGWRRAESKCPTSQK